jgi:gentisate 1,2-dioxygenase
MRPELMKAADVVSAEEAERRVLILVNQTMEAPYTTDTIYAGLQIVMPGEVAPAHRHRAFALRFIIEGQSGFTAVEGEKIEMHPGDVILTPSWSWHDHGNEGSDPIVWLDGLDLPLWQFLPINFLQQYHEPRYPSEPAAESALRISWSDVVQKLDADPSKYSLYLYKQADGTHLSNTISAQAERVAPGFTTPESQEVVSFVYHVYEGEGFTLVKDPKSNTSAKFEWKFKDTFAIPAWSRISHTCTSQDRSAYLFAINDRPLIENLTFAGSEFLSKPI